MGKHQGAKNRMTEQTLLNYWLPIAVIIIQFGILIIVDYQNKSKYREILNRIETIENYLRKP